MADTLQNAFSYAFFQNNLHPFPKFTEVKPLVEAVIIQGSSVAFHSGFSNMSDMIYHMLFRIRGVTMSNSVEFISA